MEVSGTLKGLTPKEKAQGQIIEIKIIAAFNPQVLLKLGKLFGKYVDLQIESPQQDLDIDHADIKIERLSGSTGPPKRKRKSKNES